jgi:hypothetical protein
VNFARPSFVCDCGDLKRQHWISAKQPNGPCMVCGCRAFTPEPLCTCKHGKKAHAKGPCKEAWKCGCKVFTPVDG